MSERHKVVNGPDTVVFGDFEEGPPDAFPRPIVDLGSPGETSYCGSCEKHVYDTVVGRCDDCGEWL